MASCVCRGPLSTGCLHLSARNHGAGRISDHPIDVYTTGARLLGRHQGRNQHHRQHTSPSIDSLYMSRFVSRFKNPRNCGCDPLFSKEGPD